MSRAELCTRLRHLVLDCMDKHMHTAAVFYADKLATFTGQSTDGMLLLAQAFFGSRQYRRALQLLQREGLIATDMRFKHLAASCLVECKQWDECLALLGEDATQEQASLALEPQAVGSGISLQAAMCLLRARVYEALNNRPRAKASYQAALQMDAYCYEAFSALIEGHMLTCEEEAALGRGMVLHPQDRWLALLLKAQGKKYNMENEMDAVLLELEAPLPPDPCDTDTMHHTSHQGGVTPSDCASLTSATARTGAVAHAVGAMAGHALSAGLAQQHGLHGEGCTDTQNTPPAGLQHMGHVTAVRPHGAAVGQPLHPSRMQQVAATGAAAAAGAMQATPGAGSEDDRKSEMVVESRGLGLQQQRQDAVTPAVSSGAAAVAPMDMMQQGSTAATPAGATSKEAARQLTSWNTYLKHITPAKAVAGPQHDLTHGVVPPHHLASPQTAHQPAMALLTPITQGMQGGSPCGTGEDSMSVVDMEAETPGFLAASTQLHTPSTQLLMPAQHAQQRQQQPQQRYTPGEQTPLPTQGPAFPPSHPVGSLPPQHPTAHATALHAHRTYHATPHAANGSHVGHMQPPQETPQGPAMHAAAGMAGSGAQGGAVAWGCGLQGNLDVLTCRADWLYHRGLYEPAYQLTSRLLQADAYALQVLPLHISCCCVLGRQPELFQLGHRLTEHYPDKALAWFAVGCYYMCTRQHDMARRFLARATTLEGGAFAPAWVAYAHAFSALEERDQAMAAYRTAYRLFPGLHLPLLGMGMEYAAMNNMQLAERMLLAAHELCPWDPATCHELGCVALRNGLHPVACVWLRSALQLAAQHARGGKQGVLGMPGAPPASVPADQDLVTGLTPRWEPTVVALGHSLRKQGALEEAVQWYQVALGLVPGQAGTLAALGMCYQLQGNPKEAVEVYHAALALRPDDQFTVTMLNTALVELSALDL